MTTQAQIQKVLKRHKATATIKMNNATFQGKKEHVVILGKHIDNEELVSELCGLTMNSAKDEIVPCKASN